MAKKTRLLELALQMTNDLSLMKKQETVKNKKLLRKAEILKKKMEQKKDSGK